MSNERSHLLLTTATTLLAADGYAMDVLQLKWSVHPIHIKRTALESRTGYTLGDVSTEYRIEQLATG